MQWESGWKGLADHYYNRDIGFFMVDKQNDSACFVSIQSKVEVGEIFALPVC